MSSLRALCGLLSVKKPNNVYMEILKHFGFTKCLRKAENHFRNVLEIPFKNLYQTGDGLYALK